MEARDRRLAVTLLLLTGAAGTVLAAEGLAGGGQRAEGFQRLVGGLGFGPALDLGDCPLAFDPRLDGACGADFGVVAGGACFCPRHAGTNLSPPLPPLRPAEGDEDGPFP
jgi:hypothetical protein